jgi:hypothetical protein
MREERDLSIQLAKPNDESVGAVRNLTGRFTPRATIAEDIPIRSLFANVRGATSFVVTIVPLG